MSITYTTARRKRICDYALRNGKMKAHEFYNVSRPTIDRWLKRYDGTKASLKEYSRKPKSHPNQSTEEEVKLITELWHKNKEFGLDYLYGKLKREHGYTRCRETVFNVLRRENLIYKPKKKKRNRTNKKYHGATIPGEKLQMDVKYVPSECLTAQMHKDGEKYYQYTIIDEATSLRYLYWYNSKDGYNSVDFVKRARKYFPFEIKTIQTDNGSEFTNRYVNTKAISALDKYLLEVGIEHKLIKPKTPRHNGKVERSHRNDNERFYNNLTFDSLEDLRRKGKKYLERTNKIPMAVLGYKTPLEKRRELIISLFLNYNTFISLVNAK